MVKTTMRRVAAVRHRKNACAFAVAISNEEWMTRVRLMMATIAADKAGERGTTARRGGEVRAGRGG